MHAAEGNQRRGKPARIHPRLGTSSRVVPFVPSSLRPFVPWCHDPLMPSDAYPPAITLPMLKIGSSSARATEPMTTPMRMIITGSMYAVTWRTAASSSS